MIFFFLKKTKLYSKKRLKKDKSIEIERNICWNFPSIIKLRLLSGKKPPDEISVNARFSELNDLIEKILRTKKIINVNIE